MAATRIDCVLCVLPALGNDKKLQMHAVIGYLYNTFKAALAQGRNNPVPMGRCLDKQNWDFHAAQCYSASNRKVVLTSATAWVLLGDMMLT